MELIEALENEFVLSQSFLEWLHTVAADVKDGDFVIDNFKNQGDKVSTFLGTTRIQKATVARSDKTSIGFDYTIGVLSSLDQSLTIGVCTIESNNWAGRANYLPDPEGEKILGVVLVKKS